MPRLVVTAAQVHAINAARARRQPCTLTDEVVGGWLRDALPMLERECRARLVPPVTTRAVAALGGQVALTVRGAFPGLGGEEGAVLTAVLARVVWAWFAVPLLTGWDRTIAAALEGVLLEAAGPVPGYLGGAGNLRPAAVVGRAPSC